MKYRIQFLGNPPPADEVVEADSHAIQDTDWLVFCRNVTKLGSIVVLRIRVTIVARVTVEDAPLPMASKDDVGSIQVEYQEEL